MFGVHPNPLQITTSKQEAIIIQMGAVFLQCRIDEEVILHQNHMIELLPPNTVSF